MILIDDSHGFFFTAAPLRDGYPPVSSVLHAILLPTPAAPANLPHFFDDSLSLRQFTHMRYLLLLHAFTDTFSSVMRLSLFLLCLLQFFGWIWCTCVLVCVFSAQPVLCAIRLADAFARLLHPNT